MKRIISIVFILLIGFFFYLINPNDPQYKAYYQQNKALDAYNTGDIESYFKYSENPVGLSYNYPSNLLLVKNYTIAGRYDDAIRVVKSFKKDYDYSHCIRFNPLMRAVCRIDIMVNSKDFGYNDNLLLSKIYFSKGDYKTALDFNNKLEKKNACYSASLYAANGDIKTAYEYLEKCALEQKSKKYPREFYVAAGDIYKSQKLYLQAISEYQKDIASVKCGKSCKYNNATYLLIADSYKEAGRIEQAKQYYKNILSTEPWYFKAQQGLASLGE